MKVAILGCGTIAGTLAYTMCIMPQVETYAVAARDLNRAEAFAKRWGFEKAYGSYEEMLKDPEVELVYIATPHSHHYEHIKMCIEHGKPVLCEKSFTMNADQAKEVVALAREKKVYLCEAIWTRYMPSRALINEAINSGIIGKPYALTATLWYDIDENERIIEPSLAGGALLDVGVYPINFCLMHFGDDIAKVDTSVMMTDKGVDKCETITIHYNDGRMASLTAGMSARSDRKGIIYCEKGYIVVENINNPQEIKVYDSEDNIIKGYPVPQQINGYEYEIAECIERIQAGEIESKSMPLDTTIQVMEFMDSLREKWGMKYPQEM